MKLVVQRVKRASVSVDGELVSQIANGCVVLVGVERTDDEKIVEKMAVKVSNYRFYSDQQGKMNLNIKQIGGQALVVSQFTLVADTKSGNRPGFSRGASPEQGRILYHRFMDILTEQGVDTHAGRFGANMAVELVNDGPVTFCFDSAQFGA